MHLNVCLLSLMIIKIMLITRMLALMKVYFSLLYVEWRKWMPKNVIECWLKCKNRYWIWFMGKCSLFHANECIFAPSVAVSRKWMRIFSQWTAKGVICPKKFKFAHNVFEVTELCRTRADILKPSLDRTLVVSQITKI